MGPARNLLVGSALASVLSWFILVQGSIASTLEDAQAFRQYRLFYAGEMVRDHALTDVHSHRVLGSRIWSFFYGTCEPPPGKGGCVTPLEVQNWSACARYRDWYTRPPKTFRLRGARAAWVRSAGSLDVYTGKTTVVIFADGRDLALRAARSLRNVRHAERPGSLRPPARGAMRGKLRCQR
jgi:hypothetical protein